MGEIKSISNKSVSAVSADHSPAETQKAANITKQDSVAAQSLTVDGKAAKASEAKISGEAVRHALEESLKSSSASNTSDLFSKTYQWKEKKVEVKGWATEKAAPKATEEAKPKNEMRKPSSAEKQEIANAIQSGDKDKAIQLTVKYYGIDATAAKSIKFDPNTKIAVYSPDADEIKVGTAAFWSNGKISPDKLGAALHHETVHARHEKDPKEELGQTKQGRWAEEIEVLDEGIRNAKKIGLERSVIEEMEYFRNNHYYGLNPQNKEKIDNGNYDDVK